MTIRRSQETVPVADEIGVDITMEDVDEARDRVRRERKEQGLGMSVTDPAALLSVAHTLNDTLNAPSDLDALGAEVSTALPV
jgi:hypothetical protein